MLLVDYLRDVAGLTGVKSGCDGGECGACTVLIDDEPVWPVSCWRARCEGRHIETIEGLTKHGSSAGCSARFTRNSARNAAFARLE